MRDKKLQKVQFSITKPYCTFCNRLQNLQSFALFAILHQDAGFSMRFFSVSASVEIAL